MPNLTIKTHKTPQKNKNTNAASLHSFGKQGNTTLRSHTLIVLLLATAFIFNTNASCYKKNNANDENDNQNPESTTQQATPIQNNADLVYNEDGTVKQSTQIYYEKDGKTQAHKHVTTFTYHSNKNLKTKETIGYEKGPNPVFKEYAEFSQEGYITKAENLTYKTDGTTPQTKAVLSYGENGKLTGEIRYVNNLQTSKTEYTAWGYQNSSNLPENATNHPSKKTVTTYNSDGVSVASTKQYIRNPNGLNYEPWKEEK